jgi:hypothetical protein
MSTIVVSGALANKPANGGAAWTRLSWTLGLKRLGHQVFFVEQISPAVCIDGDGSPTDFERSINVAYFRMVMQRFGLAASSALVLEGDDRTVGLSWDELSRVASNADLLVNISGHLAIDALKARFRKRIFIDLDPGYTQFWHQQNLASDRVRDHQLYFTVGESIGTSDCTIPCAGIEWHPIRQPVVLDEWPATHTPTPPVRYTTIASWRGPFGRITHEQQMFGVKAHEFRKFRTLPSVSSQSFEIALDAHPADSTDVDQLRQNGWAVVDARDVAGDPVAFRRYVQQSNAEFSVAQGIYVDTQSGWFSDRTVRYLASGKPVLVQDTGFSRHYPVGCGLLSFRNLAEAAHGAEVIASEYEAHSRGARELAESYFDSDKVLTSLLHMTENHS